MCMATGYKAESVRNARQINPQVSRRKPRAVRTMANMLLWFTCRVGPNASAHEQCRLECELHLGAWGSQLSSVDEAFNELRGSCFYSFTSCQTYRGRVNRKIEQKIIQLFFTVLLVVRQTYWGWVNRKKEQKRIQLRLILKASSPHQIDRLQKYPMGKNKGENKGISAICS